ncbi:hypothetical protein GCM10007972_22640 [Iodidimonas muriae]|uniref:TraB/GumN family protein n=2 Tax=Iodidimonas muriae TaxID=261467 RepID=A0ABQ2LF54_9PROT|nr:hypothetical protein JCM17843_20660 [Kordiimonadales bacterium JCM 17843]GGO14969.1 hypothetical protein GCM10007972_22640 [Iodidimonas muriae]
MLKAPNARTMSTPHGSAVLALMSLFILSAIVLVYGFINPAPAQAEEAQSTGTPPIWTVKNADTMLYLVGTVQLLPPDLSWRSATFDDALSTADSLILESDPRPEARSDLQKLIPQLGVLRDGRTLTDLLSEEQAAAVYDLATELSIPLPAMNPLKPWLASIQLGSMAAMKRGYMSRQGVAETLVEAAGKADTPLIFLEQASDQLHVLADLSEPLQIGMLMRSVEEIRKTEFQNDRIIDLWSKGDMETLADYLHGENGVWSDEAVYQAMVVQRNRDWANQIDAVMKNQQGTPLVAVGIGHLVGKDALPKMLAKKGYQVLRIE